MDEGFTAAHHRVAAQAARTPERPAIIEPDGRSVSYGELAARVGAIVLQLQALGVGPEDCVPVWLDRSASLIAAMLGVLEAGAVYAPIDPHSPDERVRELIARLDVAALITDRQDSATFASGRPVLMPTFASEAARETRGHSARRVTVHPGQLAYVIHTSGSTGEPKGVAMSHRGLARLIDWQIASGTPGLRTLMFTPVAFDVTFQEVFSTLGTGGTLVLVDDRVRRDPERLLSALDSLGIERLFLPYAALQQLAAAAQRSARAPGSLVHVITAGERLLVTDSIKAFFKAMPQALLDNHYGPTEAHLVTAWRLESDPDAWPELPPIGRAIDGVQVRVLDENLKLVGRNEPGELYVAGVGVARGYLADPRRTIERFVPDPYSDQPGAVMYRTGDMARQRADGVIEFEGRADDQLKVRGFRVEPAEVEHALCTHPRVLEATVGLRNLVDGVAGLVAYLVTHGSEVDSEADHQELAAHLGKRLPDYMLPVRYFRVERMPLTSSGKVDRQALSQIRMPEPLVTAETESLPDLVRSIWQRVLGHDGFGLDDDFFDVGGDSMLAAWVVTELSLALKREVSLSLFLDAGTVEASAAALAELRPAPGTPGPHAELVTLKTGPSHQVLVLIHPLGGELLAYREFAQAIATRARVLGLRLRSGAQDSGAPLSLETLAAQHLAQLVAIQPHGPYRLAGWSFGGVLAYEIARQLHARGAEVGFLGLIDANPVLDPLSGLWSRDTRLLEEFDDALARIEANGTDATSALSEHPRVRNLLGGVIPEGVTGAHLRKYLLTTRGGIDAARNYVPQPYDGSIDLFQASATDGRLQAQLASELGKLACGGLRVHAVEGDHFGMLRGPLVRATASAFDAALQRSMARTGG